MLQKGKGIHNPLQVYAVILWQKDTFVSTGKIYKLWPIVQERLGPGNLDQYEKA